MKNKRFLIGTDLFSKHRLQGGYFVDKSLLVADIIRGDDVTLIPRPRRFGKTLNLTMLKAFFEMDHPANRELFKGLKIEQDSEAMTHLGQHPTIYISLKDVRATDWEMAQSMLTESISGLIENHQTCWIKSTKPKDIETLTALAGQRATKVELQSSLRLLTKVLYEVTGQPVVLLIDEYDTPVIEARAEGYQAEMMSFLKSWLGSALKPRQAETLYRAVVTGILRIARESLFSELNNLDVSSLLNAGVYADKFGFTEDEVTKILADFEVMDHLDNVRQWYNGYLADGITLYNPWSLINYINKLPKSPQAYWLNTSSNRLIHEEFRKGGPDLKADLEKLLDGKELRYEINENIVLDDIGKNTSNIWSFLYFCGYLKADDPQPSPLNSDVKQHRLRIPNTEVSMAYRAFVQREFDDHVQGGLEAFETCFCEPDTHLSQLEPIVQQLVLSLLSYHDLAEAPTSKVAPTLREPAIKPLPEYRQPEAVFHAFFLGLLANLNSVYDIRSNHEAGYGRADIVMHPKTERFPAGFVVEFKSINRGDKVDMELELKHAMAQIKDKKYAINLQQAGVKHVYKIALVLQGKDIRVSVEEELIQKSKISPVKDFKGKLNLNINHLRKRT